MQIYADHAASTPILEGVQDRLMQALRDDTANAHAPHALGRVLHDRLEFCRQQWMETLCAHGDDRMIFTSSATESNNTIIASCLSQSEASVVYFPGDHASVVVPILSSNNDIQLHHLPLTPSLEIDLDTLGVLLTESRPTVLVLTHINSLSGHVLDIVSTASYVKSISPQTHVHVDAAQSLGKFPITLNDSVIDSMSFSSHKMGGPKGVGALYLRQGVEIDPLLKGGGQEYGLRSSTAPVALIDAFTEALNFSDHRHEENFKHVSSLAEQFYHELNNALPSAYCPFQSIKTISPYIISLFIPDISSDIIVRHLEQESIYISSRSACSSKKIGVSQEWRALHIADHWHAQALRISFCAQTTRDEVSTLVEKLASTVSRLQLLKG